MEYINTPSYYSWCGLAFERVCFLHTAQIKQALGIAGISTHEFSWRSKHSHPGAQIDLLIDRTDDVINICEIKYTQDSFSIDSDYEKSLRNKLEAFRNETGTKKALMLVFIALNGLSSSPYSQIVTRALTSDDLFLPDS